MSEAFPSWHHWELLDWVRDPSRRASLEAWASLRTAVVEVAARKFFGRGKQGRLWDTVEEAESYFLGVVLVPSLKWQDESESNRRYARIDFAEVQRGHLPFEEWKAQRQGIPVLSENQLRAKFDEARVKWKKWLEDHPLERAWQIRQQGGDARSSLLVFCRQAVRDQLNPQSPGHALREKISKTLNGSPGWFRAGSKGEGWYTLDSEDAARWLADDSFDAAAMAARFVPRDGTAEHQGFPKPLPSRQQVRELLVEVFRLARRQLPLDGLAKVVYTVFGVPWTTGLIPLDRPVGEGAEEPLSAAIPDERAVWPSECEWPEAPIKSGAALVLVLAAWRPEQRDERSQSWPAFPPSGELERMVERLKAKDVTLYAELCQRRSGTAWRVLKYFFRVWLWLELTADGKRFDYARYQRETGMKTSTFGDWKTQAEPVIQQAVRFLVNEWGSRVMALALRLLARHFVSLRPESVSPGYLTGEDEIGFHRAPDDLDASAEDQAP